MILRLDSIADPRLDDFRAVRDRPLLDRGLFLAEGETVVLRLLRSRLRCQAVVLSEAKLPRLAPHLPPDQLTYVLPGSEVSRLLGYAFHSGVVAVGLIPGPAPLEQLIPRTGPARVVVVPELTNAENLGTLVRLAAGLGADALVTGERCLSVWTRRCVRVSMGAVFTLAVHQSRGILADLARMRRELGLTALATVLSPDAEHLGDRPPPRRQAVLFGAEGGGLREDEIAACDRRLTIPMALGVDSLSVSIAAAVVLWELFARR